MKRKRVSRTFDSWQAATKRVIKDFKHTDKTQTKTKTQKSTKIRNKSDPSNGLIFLKNRVVGVFEKYFEDCKVFWSITE